MSVENVGLSNKKGKRMDFKTGDKVICLKDYVCPFYHDTQFTAGSVYIVREQDGEYCLVELDNMGNTDNGWLVKYFKLLEN